MSTRKKILSVVVTLLYVLLGMGILLQLIVSFIGLSSGEPFIGTLISTTIITVVGFFGSHYIAKNYISKIVYNSPNRSKIISGIILAVIVLAILGIYPTFYAKGGNEIDTFTTLAYMERLAFIPVAFLKGILDGIEGLKKESTKP